MLEVINETFERQLRKEIDRDLVGNSPKGDIQILDPEASETQHQMRTMVEEVTQEFMNQWLLDAERKAEHSATEISLQFTDDWVDYTRKVIKKGYVVTAIVAASTGGAIGYLVHYLILSLS